MRHPRLVVPRLVLGLVLAIMAGPAMAQQDAQPQPRVQPGAQPGSQPGPQGQQPGEGAGPDGTGTPQDHSGTKTRGSTGWTGGSNEQPQPGVGSRALSDADRERAAADQPEMATGLDLNGPPVRFPAAETPE